ncbi:MAG: hypothetical protein LIP02_04035 [Bacteroidales bacterium]|nr:hypothetical protein [Bacteroidales bacterium]
MARRYTNRTGSKTEETTLSNAISTRTNLDPLPSFDRNGVSVRQAGRVNNGKTSIYNSFRVKSTADGAYTFKRRGSVNNSKTEAQVRAQLDRIRALDSRNPTTQNYARVQRAESAAQAYSDYNALGAAVG